MFNFILFFSKNGLHQTPCILTLLVVIARALSQLRAWGSNAAYPPPCFFKRQHWKVLCLLLRSSPRADLFLTDQQCCFFFFLKDFTWSKFKLILACSSVYCPSLLMQCRVSCFHSASQIYHIWAWESSAPCVMLIISVKKWHIAISLFAKKFRVGFSLK